MQAPVEYDASFISMLPTSNLDGTKAFDILWNELDWLRIEDTPRREYYVNDINTPYTYGRGRGVRTYQPQYKHPLIALMQRHIEKSMGFEYPVIFLNGYEDQSDQLGWHSDDSPEMDDNVPIVIVSLGAEREIWFRERPELEDADPLVEKLLLQNGSMCIMKAGMQDTHQHRIPKAGRTVGGRISLTFRGYAT